MARRPKAYPPTYREQIIALPALLSLVALLSLAPHTAAAQERRPAPGASEVGIDLGASQFSGTNQMDIKPLGTRVSLFLTLPVTPSLAVGFDITCTNGMERFQSLGVEMDFTICTGSLGGQLNIPGSERLWPYVRVSAGQAQLDRGAVAEEFDVDDRSLSVQAALGSRFFFRPGARVGMRAEVQWLRTDLAGGEIRNLSVGVGVTYFP